MRCPQPPKPLPSRATVNRILLRRGLVAPRHRKRKRSDYVRSLRAVAMQLWQTSDRCDWSSGGGKWLLEGFGVVVGLAGAEAVVELAEGSVEQVAHRGGVAVADASAVVVVGACRG
jgi:hypothetical protein